MRTERSVSRTLANEGFELVSVRLLGEDPGTHSTRSIVIGRSECGYDRKYAVWNCVDWQTASDRRDRRRGIELCNGVFSLSRSEAIETEAVRWMDLMKRYTWIVPGTDRIVPGSRGSERCPPSTTRTAKDSTAQGRVHSPAHIRE